MTLEELDDALCIVQAGCEPGWIPRQVAYRNITRAFEALKVENAKLKIDAIVVETLMGEIRDLRGANSK
jgi:hypothetical protein